MKLEQIELHCEGGHRPMLCGQAAMRTGAEQGIRR